MSGGVDSAVAALLMKQRGYDCTGITMVAGNGMNLDVPLEKSGFLSDAGDARAVCEKLGMAHRMVDLREQFKRFVIDDFVNEYKSGRTPNPCVNCNRQIKFGELLKAIKEIDAASGGDGEFIYATGHYAVTEWNENEGRWQLKCAADLNKDQTYMLYNLTGEQLSHIVFPLGTFNKADVRQIASDNGLEVAAKHDSQDICFVPDGEYADFIGRICGETEEPGDFVDAVTGKVLGRHKGQMNYTIGQRKGLGLALPAPMYVTGKDIENNRVLLSDNDSLFSRELTAEKVNFCSIERPAEGEHLKCTAKIRYAHKPQPATAYMENGRLKVVFDEPQRAVTPGQSVVLYSADTVLGGGVIL